MCGSPTIGSRNNGQTAKLWQFCEVGKIKEYRIKKLPQLLKRIAGSFLFSLQKKQDSLQQKGILNEEKKETTKEKSGHGI